MKDGADALEKSSTLPSKLVATKNQILSWHYNDAAWNGWWTTNLEGLVDSGDMVVSPLRAQLSLSTSQGNVHGEFSSETICSTMPMLGTLMLDGKIRGNTLHAVGYQFIGGKRHNILEFAATPGKNGLTITPLQDPAGLLGQRIDLISAFADEQKNHENAACTAEQAKYISEHVRRLTGPTGKDGRHVINE